MRRVILIAAAFAALATAGTASADAVCHSEHLELRPLAGAPFRSGFVQNIHPNGPQVYAHEVYVLNGAMPNTTYVVRLWVYPFDTDCSGTGVNFASTTIHTNRAGNGRGDLFISPTSVPNALRSNQTHGVRWDVTSNGAPQYETRCTQVTLD